MRWIRKPPEPPVAIAEYRVSQVPVGHGLDYPTFSQTAAPGGPGSGSRGAQLCRELITQQHGLFAYTGAPIDHRIGEVKDPDEQLAFRAHNEHLKPQSVCRAELEAAGGVYGVDLGEDMAPSNIVAALLVSGAGNGKIDEHGLFGAAKRKNDPVPVYPTDPACETKFLFDENGGIYARQQNDADAQQVISVLKLDHYTLETWRREAITGFVDDLPENELRTLRDRIRNPGAQPLPEYSFVLLQIIEGKLPAP